MWSANPSSFSRLTGACYAWSLPTQPVARTVSGQRPSFYPLPGRRRPIPRPRTKRAILRPPSPAERRLSAAASEAAASVSWIRPAPVTWPLTQRPQFERSARESLRPRGDPGQVCAHLCAYRIADLLSVPHDNRERYGRGLIRSHSKAGHQDRLRRATTMGGLLPRQRMCWSALRLQIQHRTRELVGIVRWCWRTRLRNQNLDRLRDCGMPVSGDPCLRSSPLQRNRHPLGQSVRKRPLHCLLESATADRGWRVSLSRVGCTMARMFSDLIGPVSWFFKSDQCGLACCPGWRP